MAEPMMAGLTMPDVLNLIVQHGEMVEILEELDKEWTWDDKVGAPQSPVVPRARALLNHIRGDA